MLVIVPHRTTAEKAIAMVGRSADRLFEGIGGTFVELADRKNSWKGPVMDFSLTARVGFISVPISGTVTVDDINVTIDCHLPALVDKFVGEEKVRATIEGRVRGILGE